ncbi:MAG: endopeptidase La [Chloroflexota bacterium]|nr:endopeptidase La [Chloroflexota bacterium]
MTDTDETRDTPQTEDTPAEDAPNQDAPTDDVQTVEISAEDAPTADAPTDDVQTVEISAAAAEQLFAGKVDDLDIPAELPIVPLKDTVIYPFVGAPLAVGQERTLKLMDDAVVGNRLVGFVASKDATVDNPGPDQAYTVGVVGAIMRMMRLPNGTMQLAVQGLERIKIEEYTQTTPYLKARIRLAPDEVETGMEMDALARNLKSLFGRLVDLMPHLPEELATVVLNIDNPRQLVYLIASALRMDLEIRQAIIETDSVRAKLERLTGFLSRELEMLELGKKLQNQVQGEVEKTQREYLLREQMKAIQKELGESNEQEAEVAELRGKIEAANMPEEAAKEARRELDRLERLPAAAAEYGVIKTYLDWLVSMPWNVYTEKEIDIAATETILHEDHYDLEKIKERILEYLAVRKLKTQRQGAAEGVAGREPILCFVGPPGVGKTSLAQSIARALGRPFTRMSLGGVHDEAEIRGHRRTYIGAMPGRIVQAIRRAEAADPVFVLDVVDKLGSDFRGDPSSALLEVLDPEQNKDFRDHYLDVPFDLSHVMFIATANQLDPIPPALRDRMEVLDLSGYTEEEKLHIAQRFLVPKQLKAHALTEADLTWHDAAIRTIVQDYTREAGVRNLEREIAAVSRKIAREVATRTTDGSEEAPAVEITPEKVRQVLGRARYHAEVAERVEQPGVATGLVWTPVGGDIIFIEASRMPGSKQLTITGQLGDVMRESAVAAMSWVRTRAHDLHIPEEFITGSDIHLHVPAGAIPKDGPSAGITMTTALASLLTGRAVKDDVAMTGEITLRGRVLPVGGVKEKLLGAHRAGIKTVILSRRNEGDLDDITPELREAMQFVLVDTMDEVLAAALVAPSPDSVAAQEELKQDIRREQTVSATADGQPMRIEIIGGDGAEDAQLPTEPVMVT